MGVDDDDDDDDAVDMMMWVSLPCASAKVRGRGRVGGVGACSAVQRRGWRSGSGYLDLGGGAYLALAWRRRKWEMARSKVGRAKT